jgi:hypothetical protein
MGSDSPPRRAYAGRPSFKPRNRLKSARLGKRKAEPRDTAFRTGRACGSGRHAQKVSEIIKRERRTRLSERVRRVANQSRKVIGLHRVVNAATVLVIMPAHMLAPHRCGNGRDSDLTVPRAERGKVFGAVTRSL